MAPLSTSSSPGGLGEVCLSRFLAFYSRYPNPLISQESASPVTVVQEQQKRRRLVQRPCVSVTELREKEIDEEPSRLYSFLFFFTFPPLTFELAKKGSALDALLPYEGA